MSEGLVYWTVISYVDLDKLQDALDAWFFTSSTLEQSMGDMACMDVEAYHKCVRWIEVPLDARHVTMDVNELHPIHDAVMVFYHLREAYCKACVLGLLTYADVMQRLHGVISVGDDLHVRNRAVAAPRHLETQPALEPVGDSWLFYFPHHVIEASGDPPSRQRVERMCQYVNSESFTRYRLFLAAPWSPTTICNPRLSSTATASALERAGLELGCSMLCAALGEYLEFVHMGKSNQLVESEARRQRVRYDEKRLDTERLLLSWRMQRFRDEKALIRLLKFNYCSALLAACVDGTTRDAQCFWAMYPDAHYDPIVYFAVSLEHLPPQWFEHMPVYEGGLVHLPCYWIAIGTWVWNRHVVASQQRFVLYRKLDHDAALASNPLVAAWLHQQFSDMPKTTLCPNVEPREPGSQPTAQRRWTGTATSYGSGGVDHNVKKRYGSTRVVPKDDGIVVPDLEDIWKLMPSCVVALNEKRRRYKNLERLRLAEILYGADLHVEGTIRPFFAAHYRKYPDGNANWDFSLDGALKTVHNATFCGNLVKNALDRAPESMACPYVAQVELQPSMTAQDVTRACRGMCGVRGSGPHDFIRNRWKELGMQITVGRATISSATVDEEDEDDEEDEEAAFANVIVDEDKMEESSE